MPGIAESQTLSDSGTSSFPPFPKARMSLISLPDDILLEISSHFGLHDAFYLTMVQNNSSSISRHVRGVLQLS